MKLHINFIVTLFGIAINSALCAADNAISAPITLPTNYQKTLTEIFKGHEFFNKAVPEILALGERDAS